jgi:hypothetical protein
MFVRDFSTSLRYGRNDKERGDSCLGRQVSTTLEMTGGKRVIEMTRREKGSK